MSRKTPADALGHAPMRQTLFETLSALDARLRAADYFWLAVTDGWQLCCNGKVFAQVKAVEGGWRIRFNGGPGVGPIGGQRFVVRSLCEAAVVAFDGGEP